MLKTYLKIAWRNLVRYKAYTCINLSGITLGITACLVIFLLASFELSYDKFHTDSKRIYRVVGSMTINGTQNDYGYVPAPLPLHLMQQVSGLEKVAGFYNYYAKVTIPQQRKEAIVFDRPKPEVVSPVIIAQPDYFSIFQYEWLAGNASIALNDPFKVVLTEQEAHRFFGKLPVEQIIGKEIIYNDSLQVSVSGIIKAWDRNTDFNFSNIISFATIEHSFLKNEIDLGNWRTWDSYSQAFVKLGNNIKPEQVNAQLTAFIKTHLGQKDAANIQLKLQSLSDIHFNALYTDAFSRKAHLPTLYVLIGIAVFILLIASINYINLSTALSVQRSKEIGIRKVLGSSRVKLVLQFISETAIVTSIAILISVVLVKPVLSLFQSFLPAGIYLQPFSVSTWLFFTGIFLVTILLAGFYPAAVLSAGKPVISSKGKGGTNTPQTTYLRKGLIVFQFTISLVFIIGTIGIGNQIHYLLNKDMGFYKDAIINIKMPSAEDTLHIKKLFAEKIRQLPDVATVSLHRETPAAIRHGNTTIKAGASEINASFEFCDENFVPLYGIKILEGRNLQPSDTIKEFLINAVGAKQLGYKTPADAIGQTVQTGMSGKSGTIAGVINDFHAQSLHETIKPFFITTNARRLRTLSIKLSTAGKQTTNFKNTLAGIQQTWNQLYPGQNFEYSFFDQTVASFYETEQKTARLVNIAMMVTIFISCIGLYGMTAFIIRQRNKEIGIRKVLGANTGRIVMMLFKDFLKPVFIAIIVASPVAWYFLYRWLENFPFKINISWVVFALAGLCAVAIATFTVSFQAMRAANANPAKSIIAD